MSLGAIFSFWLPIQVVATEVKRSNGFYTCYTVLHYMVQTD